MNIINPFHTDCTARIHDSYPDHVPRSPITSQLDAAQVLAFAGANGDIAWHIENELENGVNATIFNRYLPFSCPLRYFRY